MKQFAGLLLVLTLASFSLPLGKSPGRPIASTKISTYNLWFINYTGAGDNMTIHLGPHQFVTQNAEPGQSNYESFGPIEEGSYSFSISKNVSDNVPRYVQVEDPYYQNYPSVYYYWNSSVFYGNFTINDIFNQLSIGFL